MGEYLTPKKFSELFDQHAGQAHLYFLSRCSETDSLDEIDELIKLGINLKKENILNRAFVSSCAGNIGITLYFLNKGADINALNGQALVQAVGKSNWQTLKFLLERGIKLTSYNVVHSLYKFNYQEVMDILWEHGYDKMEIAKILFGGLIKNSNHIDAIGYMIDNDVDLKQIFIKNDVV